MQINTKKNIEDTIYYMDGMHPRKGIVKGIETFCGKATLLLNHTKSADIERPHIMYYVDDNPNPISERCVFDTKEELQQALFNTLD